MDASPAADIVTLHPRGILFDMDGVLVSSIGSVERTWEAWAKARGIDPALAIRTAHGRRAIETVRQLRPDLNDMEELAWLERMEIADNGGLAMLAGVERILENLPEKYWTVVTSATERLARSRMEYGGMSAAFRSRSSVEPSNDPAPRLKTKSTSASNSSWLSCTATTLFTQAAALPTSLASKASACSRVMVSSATTSGPVWP
jgi:hypothetical protein